MLWYGCRHRLHGLYRLHWGLHHDGLVLSCIARPWHGRWRQRLAFAKTGGCWKWHHSGSFPFALSIVPGSLRPLRLPALLWGMSATLRALSIPILLSIPSLVVIPAGCVRLLGFLPSRLMNTYVLSIATCQGCWQI